MDAVIFEVKRAHLAVQRLARGLRWGEALTPARFDLLYALGDSGMRQCDLWRRLSVVRSVVCEMVRAIERLGWVRRTRDRDRRTWWIRLTAAGREVMERVIERCISSGRATLHIDAALTRESLERDVGTRRNELLMALDALTSWFRVAKGPPGRDLYCWRMEDLWVWFSYVGEPQFEGDIPFIS